jgi:hypothetical protein
VTPTTYDDTVELERRIAPLVGEGLVVKVSLPMLALLFFYEHCDTL